jgi:hypothetical protein
MANGRARDASRLESFSFQYVFFSYHGKHPDQYSNSSYDASEAALAGLRHLGWVHRLMNWILVLQLLMS